MPPRPIFIALYREGNSDDYFLPILIRRTLDRVIAGRERYPIDFQNVTIVNERERIVGSYVQRILRAAEIAEGHNILIVHRDSDSREPDQALHDFAEAKTEVLASSRSICKHLIPITPVRMIESWMLADPSALLAAMNSQIPKDQLGLPDQPHQIEAIPEPKVKLNTVEKIACRNRKRNRLEREDLFNRLAETINLDLLARVPSYHRFEQDLTRIMVELGLIHTVTGR